MTAPNKMSEAGYKSVHEQKNATRTGKLLSVGESEIKNLRAPLSMKVQLVAPIAAIF